MRRTAPFTATEHARGAALADLVTDVLARGRAARGPDAAGAASAPAPPRVRRRRATRSGRVVDGTRRSAWPWSRPRRPTRTGVTTPVDAAGRPGLAAARDRHPALVDAARLAGTARAPTEIVLTTRADNQAVLPMVLAAGLRGRIRMAARPR